MISSLMCYLAVYVAMSAILIGQYKHDELISNSILLYKDEDTSKTMIPIWVMGIISLLFLILDTDLVLFHIYLTKKNLTTFDYITLQKEKKENIGDFVQASKAQRRTCLDFVLCLKKRKLKTTTPAPSQNPYVSQEIHTKNEPEVKIQQFKDESPIRDKNSSLNFEDPSKIVLRKEESKLADHTNKSPNHLIPVAGGEESVDVIEDQTIEMRFENGNKDPPIKSIDGKVKKLNQNTDSLIKEHYGTNPTPILDNNITPIPSKKSKQKPSKRNQSNLRSNEENSLELASKRMSDSSKKEFPTLNTEPNNSVSREKLRIISNSKMKNNLSANNLEHDIDRSSLYITEENFEENEFGNEANKI